MTIKFMMAAYFMVYSIHGLKIMLYYTYYFKFIVQLMVELFYFTGCELTVHINTYNKQMVAAKQNQYII